MPSWTWPLTILLLAGLCGCSINGPNSTVEELGQDANTRGFGRQFPEDPNESAFVFGVGDEVIVTVADEPTISGAFPQKIRYDGNITVPLINDVFAAGETTDGLRRKLELRLLAYFNEPQITVSVGEITSKNIYVTAVDPRTGGYALKKLPYRGDTTLLDVFVDMGAPSTILDDEAAVKVIRGDPRYPRVLTINVREIFTQGYTGGNIQIRPNDIVYVPPTLFGKFNALIAGISFPFQSLFTITRSIVAVDYSVSVISGDDEFHNGTTYY